MKDQSKTKQVLIQELASLRQRIAELEQSESERKLAEETVRESEEQFRVAQELSPDGFTILRPIRDAQERVVDFTWVYENATIARLNGTDPKAVVGRRLLELFPGHSGSQFLRAYQLVAESGEHCVFEADYCGESITKPTWFRIAVVPMGGDIAILAQDITERKRLEEALKFTRFSVDNAAETMVCVDRNARFIDVNDTFCRSSGYSREELLSMTVHDIDPDYSAEIWPEFWEKLKQSESLTFETCHRSKEGRIFPVEITANFFEYKGKEYHCGFARDITERKLAKEALWKSEENFRHSLEESPLGVRIVTMEGKTIYANRGILDIYGYDSIEELRTTPIQKRYTPESYAEFQIRREKRKRGDYGPSEYGISIVRKDGEVRRLQVFRKEILWDGEKQFEVIYQDITERKRAEEALRESEARYRQLLENALAGIYEIDLTTGRILSVNDVMCKYTGYTRDELLATKALDLLTGESQKIFMERMAGLASGKPVLTTVEYQVRSKSGREFWMSLNNKYFYKAGVPVRSEVIAYDITERKRAEEALQESEERLRDVIFSIADWVWEVDENGVYTHSSQKGIDLFGKSRGDIIGKTPFDFMPPDEAKRVAAIFSEIAANKLPIKDLENWNINKNSERICLLTNGVPILDEDGNLKGYRGVDKDITDHKRVEEELRTSRFQLRALAARLRQIREEERIMIAREIHDEMGGGLTGMKMDLSQMLHIMGDADPGEARVAVTDRIHACNALIDHMIQVVRRISTDLRPSVLDDLGLVAALEWQLSEFTSRTEIQHEFATTVEYVNMEADIAVAMFRIFQEALTNVVRHARATKVAVFLREGERSLSGDESLVLEIRDNGRGITEEEILNPKSLGLLGMKERVLAFGGELSIRGEPGGGTALILNIPRKQGEPS